MDAYRAKLAREPVPDEDPERFEHARQLLDHEAQVQESLAAYLRELPEGELDHVRELPMPRGPIRSTPREVLQHLVNHSTYHRGQIALQLKERGVEYPETDLIGWFAQRHQEAGHSAH